MNPFLRAQVPIGAGGRLTVSRAHAAAVACGTDLTGRSSSDESIFSTQDLLCAAGDAVVELAMAAQLFDAHVALDLELSDEQSRALRQTASGVARLTARALEIHARDTGYDPEIWFADAREETARLMADDRDPLFEPTASGVVDLTRIVSGEIFSALAATPADRMGVPGHISRALGIAVALFMIATTSDHDSDGIRYH